MIIRKDTAGPGKLQEHILQSLDNYKNNYCIAWRIIRTDTLHRLIDYYLRDLFSG